MIFTPDEIQRLFDIIDYRLARIVADVLGESKLSSEDKELLKRYGYKWKDELKKLPPYYQSYLFGRLSGQLTPSQLKTLDYNDLLSYIDKKQYKVLTTSEKAMYNAAATRTYSYIKTMGKRMRDILSNSISEEEVKLIAETQRQLELTTIKKEIIEGTLKKKSIQSIISSIGHSLDDWNRDWGRIVETEMQYIYQIGVAQQIMNEHGAEALVYKQVYPQACLPTDETEFLTKDGFKFLKDINEDTDLMATYNLETNTLEYSSIKRKIQYIYKGDMNMYKHKNIEFMVTPNHKMLVGKKRRINNKYFIRNELIESQFIPKNKNAFFRYTVENWEGYDIDTIEIAGKIFNTKDFSQFMGWYLSEGSCYRKKITTWKGKNHVVNPRISISQRKITYIDEIEECLERCFKKKAYNCQDDHIVCLDQSFNDFIEWLKDLGDKAWKKRIPDEIKMLSKEYLNIFLNSYLHGDGYSNSNLSELGSEDSSIITSSLKMRDDLMEIILKCGFRTSYRILDNIGKVRYSKELTRFETKRLMYVISICKTKNFTLPYKYFKVVRNWEGEVGCVEVEKNNTLFVRIKGKCIWVGNCKYCQQLYTTGGVGTKPRIFKLIDLIANGDNIGLKSKDWKPTLGPIHPFCRCNMRYIPKSYVWNDETQSFEPVKHFDRKVERRSKVKITVGNKEFIV